MSGFKYSDIPGLNDFILKNYKGLSNAELTKKINKKFKLSLSTSQIKGYKGNRHLDSGLTGRFEKGSVPFNLGKHFRASPATEFKKGHLPHNTRPIGSEELRADGYYWIKVNENRGPHNIAKRWIPKSRYVWEMAYGPLDEGLVVIHLNNNPIDDRLENLMPVEKGISAIMSKSGLFDNDPDITKAGVSLAKLKIQINKKERKIKNGG